MKSNGMLRDGMIGGISAAVGFIFGTFLRSFLRKRNFTSNDSGPRLLLDDSDWFPSVSNLNEPHKLVLCVRTDLRMERGKIAAQVGHATLGAYKKAQQQASMAVQSWESQAQPKIALQIRSKNQADRLERLARGKGLTTFMVYDAGRTQVAAGTMTVLAIGPGPARVVDQVTGTLKLL